MKDFFTFAENSPFLTFFLFCVVASCIAAMFKYVAYAIRGDPNIVKNGEDDEP